MALVLFAMGPRVAHSAGSPTSLPLEYYQQHGLTPARRPSRGKPVEASGPDVLKTYENILSVPGELYIDLQPAAEVLNDSITIENRGGVDIVNPWVVINGKRDWFDTPSILKEALAGETDPERRAFRIWRFVRDNRYHWTPAEPEGEIHDPVKLFNVYGYGFCDDAASVSEALFHGAGFQDARCWMLQGHVVPEVYYNLGWHMFDADLQVFYPRRESSVVASVDACMQDGWLVERVSGPTIRDIYTSIENNQFYRKDWLTSHTMAMTLRPGESLKRQWQGWGAYHIYSMPAQPAPPLVGNGSLKYDVPLADAAATGRGLTQMTNIEVTTAGTLEVPRLFLAGSGSGQVMLDMRSPYVFVDGRLRVVAYLAGKSDELLAEFSRDGVDWRELGRQAGPLEGPLEWSLKTVIGPVWNTACYMLHIRLTLKGGARASASLSQLLVEGTIQCSPLGLPALEAARINPVSVRFAAAPEARLAVTQECRVLMALPTDPEAQLISPRIHFGILKPATFFWSLDTPLAEGFEAMVSRDKDGVLPVAPPLWQWCGTATQWNPDTEFLAPSQQYWWGVRYRDTAGNWRRWSTPQAFSYENSNGVTTWREYE